MFGNRKKKIQHVAEADLRPYSAEAVSKIRSIKHVGMIFLPENPSAEFMNAYADVKKEHNGMEIFVSPDKKVSYFNGAVHLSGAQIPSNSLCMANGAVIISDTENVENTEFIVNGVMVLAPNAKINISKANGKVERLDIDYDKLRLFGGEIRVNNDTIRNLEENATLAAGGRMIIESDVTEDEIVNKNIHFIAGGQIICNEAVYGCICARSTVGGGIKKNEK